MLYTNRRGVLVHLNDIEAARGVADGEFTPVVPVESVVVEETIEEVIEEATETDGPSEEELKQLLKDAGVKGVHLYKKHETLVEKCKELELI